MRSPPVVGLVLVGALTFAGAASARPAPAPALPGWRVLVLDRGHVTTRIDRYASGTGGQDPAPTPSPRPPGRPAPRALAARGSAVRTTLARLVAGHAISSVQFARYRSDYAAAVRSAGRISGTRRSELGAVLANLDQIAAAGRLAASRLPALFETLRRNRQWWTTGPLLSSGARVGFAGSKLVWEYYPGQGIEIQWLGTFGKANGYFLSHSDSSLYALLDEATAMAATRASGIAWEYEFQFDGGHPPWVSALAQGTAIQSLSRAASRRGDRPYLDVAHRALGIFRRAPPEGVRESSSHGSHYLIYSFAPGERVLNGFIQSLVGLHDLTVLGADTSAKSLFEAGDAEARAEVPHFDTGAWSLYDQVGESDLSYHELLRDFLLNLCARTRADAAGPNAAVRVATRGQSTISSLALRRTRGARSGAARGSSKATGAAAQNAGGSRPPARGVQTPPAPALLPATSGRDAVYCSTALAFDAYEHTAPAITVASQSGRVGHSVRVRLRLSKISSVRLVVSRGGQVAYSASLTLARGSHFLIWRSPSAAGSYSVSVAATDLAGNHGHATGTLAISGR